MRRHWAVLLGILVMAAFLRFHGLERVGVFNVDESRTLLDARAKHEEMGIFVEMFQRKWAETHGGPEFLLSEYLPEAHARLQEHHPVFPKYLLAYSIACMMFIFGFTPWVGHVVEAFFGTLTVWLIYLFVKSLFTRREGVLAAGLLAVSGFHVYFSRNTYSESLAVFLWLLCFFAHFAWGRRVWTGGAHGRRGAMALLLSGLFAGLAFLATFQITAALPALPVLHGLVCLGERGWRARVRSFVVGGALMACGFLAAVLALELVNYPMFLLYRSEGLMYPHTTPFESFIRRWGYHSSRGIHPSGMLVFPYFLGVFEGWFGVGACVVLVGLGLCRIWADIVADRDAETRARTIVSLVYLGVGIVVPFLVFSVKTITGARVFSCVMPFLIALVAACAVALFRGGGRRRGLRRGVVVAALMMAASSSLWSDVRIMRIRSAYPEVLAWLRDRGETTVISPWQGPLSWHLTCEGMRQPWETRARYCVTDWQEVFSRRYPDNALEVKEGAVPVAVFEHRFDRLFVECEAIPHEPGSPLKELMHVRALDEGRFRKVLVYRVEDTVFGGDSVTPSAGAIHQ